MTGICRRAGLLTGVALCCALIISTAGADVIELDDGRSYEGTITHVTETEAELVTEFSTMTIRRERIKAILFGAKVETGPTQEELEERERERKQQEEQDARVRYEQGKRAGRDAGYSEGLVEGRREQKSARMSAAWGGFLLSAGLALVVVLFQSGALQ